jgi:hypothetical protein
MVVTIHIDRWDVTRILIDNDSQAEILFLSFFKKIGHDRKHLKEPMMPLYGFSDKWIELVRVITLSISFDTLENPRTKYITFDIVDMNYPYNVIFGRGLLNTFEVTLPSEYLCLKISSTFGVMSVFDSQKDAKNIEQGFAPGHKNVDFLREKSEQYQQSACPLKAEALTEFKKVIDADGDLKKVALDPRVSDRVVCLGTKTNLEEQAELLAFLYKNSDIFTWSTSNLIGVNRDVIEHRLQVNPNAKTRKQKLQKMYEEKVEAAKAEV